MDTQEKRLTKAKIALQKEKPFWGYLCFYLDLHEDTEVETARVDKNANLYYSREFIESLDIENIKTLIAHKICHLTFQHHERRKNRDRDIWNLSADIVVNDLLKKDQFILMQNEFYPVDNRIMIEDMIIDDVDTKTTERLYDEISQKIRHTNISLKTPDDLLDSSPDPEQDQRKDIDWRKALAQAQAFAKSRGSMPAHLSRFVDRALYPKADLSSILHYFIVREIPYDFVYTKPSKKFYSTDIYFPSLRRENIDIVAAIDTSGSIGEEDLKDFVSIISHIAHSFLNVHLTLIVHDAAVQDVYELHQADYEKILDLDFKGGGGTSHVPVFEWVSKNRQDCRLLICLTDGNTEFPPSTDLKTLWVLNNEIYSPPFGELVRY